MFMLPNAGLLPAAAIFEGPTSTAVNEETSFLNGKILYGNKHSAVTEPPYCPTESAHDGPVNEDSAPNSFR